MPSVVRATIHDGRQAEFCGQAGACVRHLSHLPPGVERCTADAALACELLRRVDAHNPGSYDHGVRVSRLVHMIATSLRMPVSLVRTISEAALLHDVGKIAVSAEVLRKAGPLNESERKAVRVHVPAGVKLVAGIPAFGQAAVFIRASHEWLNGGGYPRGLRGEAIPLGSRIISVADAFDVLTHARTYRGAMTPDAALAEMRLHAGTQFDPLVVLALEHVAAVARAVVREDDLRNGHEGARPLFDARLPGTGRAVPAHVDAFKPGESPSSRVSPPGVGASAPSAASGVPYRSQTPSTPESACWRAHSI